MDADVGYSLYVTQNTPMNIRVLYVDHESKDIATIEEIFAQFSCEVNIVKFASTASLMLSKGKSQYDLLIENVDSPDSYGFKLLQDATKMELPVILLTNEDNLAITTRAIEEGAILCVQKPITIELVKYLWQHVLREKTLKIKKNEILKETIELYKLHDTQTGQVHNNDVPPKRKKTINQNVSKNNEGQNKQDCGAIRSGKKRWIEWTPELHEKFLAAVRILGEGRCYPKDILELMNVHGLNRMHVASHLQKCRYGGWHLNYIRKYNLGFSPEDTTGLLFDIPPARSRRFGTMPHLGNISTFTLNTQEQANNQFETLPIPNNVHEQSYQAPVNQQDFNGYIPFGHDDTENIENNGHVGFSLDDMFTCDAQSGIDMSAHNQEVGYNGQLQEFGTDDHMDYISQMPFMLETNTDIWSHEASNSR